MNVADADARVRHHLALEADDEFVMYDIFEFGSIVSLRANAERSGGARAVVGGDDDAR